MTVADLEAGAWRKFFREPGAATEQCERAAMGDADLEAQAWRAAAACEMEDAVTPAGELYGMEAIFSGAAFFHTAEGADAGSAQEVDTEALQQQQQQARRRQDMLPRLRLCPNRPRQHGFERRLQGAEAVAKLLRQRVTLPADLEKQRN